MEKYVLKTAALTLSAGASLFFVSLSASPQAAAADIFSPPQSLKDSPALFAPIPWQGFYIGGHAGGVWGDTSVHDDFTYVGDPSFNGGLGSAGFIGGAQAGYNFQRGNVVFGLEGDIGYLGLSASKDVSFKPSSCTGYYNSSHTDFVDYNDNNGNRKLCDIDAKYGSSSNLYGDVTGRIGYAFNRTLFYAKGGVAFLDADFKANYSGQNANSVSNINGGAPSTFNYDHSDTLVGWTIGAGIEYALTPSWSLKAEYQHFDFGSMSYSYSSCYAIPGNWGSDPTYGKCPANVTQYSNHYTSTLNGKTDVSLTADAVTVGLNYHINGEAALK